MAQSKASRARSKAFNRQRRNAIREERRNRYAAEGREGKHKKKSSKGGGFNTYKHSHATAMCGNHGCSRCFPKLAA